MKKSLLIVASLALGTTAFAQDTSMPAGSPPMSTAPSSPDSSMPMQPGSTPDSSMPAPGGQPPMSGDTAPSAAPAPGGDMPSGTAPGASGSAMATPTDTSSYPKCSKGVTDKCVQAGGSGHGMMHKKMMRHPRHK